MTVMRKEVNLMKILGKLAPQKLIPIAIFGLGLITQALTNINSKNEREVMKSEIKQELIDELLSDKN